MPDDTGSALSYFKAQKKHHTDQANAIIQTAKSEGRKMTDEERGRVQEHIDAASEFRDNITAEAENDRVAREVAQLASDQSTEPVETVGSRHRSMAAAMLASDAWKGLKERGTQTGRFTMSPVEVPRFGAVNEGIVHEAQGDNADMILPVRIPGIQGPVEAPLAIAALFSSATISRGNTVLLAKETVSTNATAVTAELAAKQASDIQFDTEQVTLDKLATIIKVSTEMLEDEDAMLTYLENRLETFVLQKEEAVLIVDLLAQAGQNAYAFDIDGTNLFDAILAGAVKVRTEGGLDADAVVLTPLDFAKLSVLKNEHDDYYSGGPYGAAGRLLWGRYQVALSERLGDGNCVVGAFREGGTIWRKSTGVNIDATNSNEDDFKKNLTAIRAEERMALFLQRPDAFCIVSETS